MMSNLFILFGVAGMFILPFYITSLRHPDYPRYGTVTLIGATISFINSLVVLLLGIVGKAQ